MRFGKTPSQRHLLHGKESNVFVDSGYRWLDEREVVQKQHPDVNWHVAMMPSKRKALDMTHPVNVLVGILKTCKASVRGKVAHPFRGIKCQLGHRMTRYRALAQNTTQLLVLFALSNVWMVRKRILQEQQASVRMPSGQGTKAGVNKPRDREISGKSCTGFAI